jgi:Reverse transcriptase (RNA-dependent DNA polymerase)
MRSYAVLAKPLVLDPIDDQNQIVGLWLMLAIQDLLEKGYLPRELPPPFNSSSFATYAVQHGSTWQQRWTKSVTHNLARPGGLRRPLKIPNPIAYFGIADLVCNNTLQVFRHTWKVRLSASRPYLTTHSSRAVVSRYGLRERARLRALRRRSSKYLLRTDINQFYPSIYTHSIPWALHSKSLCKSVLNTAQGNALLGNQLDVMFRRLNDGQTVGIPIGPDVSFLAAEMLLAAVDQALLAKVPYVAGFRYVDDYELSFASLGDAEYALAEIQGILYEYELTLNPRKTYILELPQGLSDTWAVELGRFLVRDKTNPVGQRNDILALFSRAFELSVAHPEDPVIRYAIARVQNQDVPGKGWRAFQNCVLGAASSDASALPVALGTLYQVATVGGHTIAKSPLAAVFENIILGHAGKGHGSEVAWALWGALAWQVPLSGAVARSISEMEDDIVALLALDADSKSLFPKGTLNTQKWTRILASNAVLTSEHWLLAYEANRRNWLNCPSVNTHSAFSAMRVAGVSFYDPMRNVPQYPPGARSVSGGELPDHYA